MKLSAGQLDVLTEMINIGVGLAASVLNDMVQAHVQLQVPRIRVLSPEEFVAEISKESKDDLASVQLPFKSETFSGRAMLIFPPESASKLVSLLTEETQTGLNLDEERSSTLAEIGNILLNGVMGSISNILSKKLDYSLPYFREDSLKNVLEINGGEEYAAVIVAETHFSVLEHNIEGDVLILLGTRSLDALKTILNTLKEGR